MTPFQYIVKKNKWFTPTDRVLIAVSGGVDSIVLLDMMCQLPSDLRPIIGVAHVNHQLRDVSDVEEQFVQELATAYDVPCYCYRWAEGADLQAGIEYEAREIRYQFFEQVMMDQQFNVLLTAHHQDDQAETVLMKLIRGGLLEEKTGIPQQRTFGPGKIIRPLLDYTKVELRQYAAEHKLAYKEDASNASDQFLRNRLRHDVLPQLQAENPQVVAHLSEFAQELAELVEAYQLHLQELLVKVIELDEESLTVDIPLLLSHSRAVQKLLLKEGLKKVFQQEGQFNKQYIEETLDWLQTSTGNSRLDWQGGWQCIRTYNVLRIQRQDQPAVFKSTDEVVISVINQWYELSPTEMFGVFNSGIDQSELPEHALVLSIPQAAIKLPLRLRHRQPGDRMTYKGGRGTKKLKDIFINQKVPKVERDQAWLVVEQTGCILWAIGYKQCRLSNDAITDTMNYILVYQKDDAQE
ncbi:tRNA lysidine(34) synthetase TilS [Dolosigranulum pigrum]|uniref:tRNA(Ile)-lysidine synthase n=1 Tax=Dolosigranulum pigrum ATCC 51524 TaxID=883103 RepID=H3ND70_9LACT|nr:tRNA lysidine(34) synthetase TilS [Dolosigranulum pigrum]EHR34289.1 tRNA(Ile)-lysidine synthetase [Dolosigranulum pigrum ATCC 51524]